MSKRINISENMVSINQLEFTFFLKAASTVGRVFRHYTQMEEYTQGMWRGVKASERDAIKTKAANLMKNPGAFRDAMRHALRTWPNSSAVNLTDRNQNRIAWLGHAGCCVATGSPEDVTREAWWTLTGQEQDLANQAAADVINEWEIGRYAETIPRN